MSLLGDEPKQSNLQAIIPMLHLGWLQSIHVLLLRSLAPAINFFEFKIIVNVYIAKSKGVGSTSAYIPPLRFSSNFCLKSNFSEMQFEDH